MRQMSARKSSLPFWPHSTTVLTHRKRTPAQSGLHKNCSPDHASDTQGVTSGVSYASRGGKHRRFNGIRGASIPTQSNFHSCSRWKRRPLCLSAQSTARIPWPEMALKDLQAKARCAGQRFAGDAWRPLRCKCKQGYNHHNAHLRAASNGRPCNCKTCTLSIGTQGQEYSVSVARKFAQRLKIQPSCDLTIIDKFRFKHRVLTGVEHQKVLLMLEAMRALTIAVLTRAETPQTP